MHEPYHRLMVRFVQAGGAGLLDRDGGAPGQAEPAHRAEFI